MSLRSSYPAEGKIEVKLHKDTPLFIRIPQWAGERINLFLNKKPQVLIWKNDYISIPKTKKGQTVTVTHSMPEDKRKETVRGQEFFLSWRGSTLLEIFPQGDPIALYQRYEKPCIKAEPNKPAPTQ